MLHLHFRVLSVLLLRLKTYLSPGFVSPVSSLSCIILHIVSLTSGGGYPLVALVPLALGSALTTR